MVHNWKDFLTRWSNSTGDFFILLQNCFYLQQCFSPFGPCMLCSQNSSCPMCSWDNSVNTWSCLLEHIMEKTQWLTSWPSSWAWQPETPHSSSILGIYVLHTVSTLAEFQVCSYEIVRSGGDHRNCRHNWTTLSSLYKCLKYGGQVWRCTHLDTTQDKSHVWVPLLLEQPPIKLVSLE